MSQSKADQMKRKWLLLMILGPGIFFIVYWLAMKPGVGLQTEKIKLPDAYLTPGQTATAAGVKYTVPAHGITFTDTIQLKKNTAIAEPGSMFICMGLKYHPRATPPEAIIIGADGGSYRALQLEQALIASNFNFTDSDIFLYLFKIPAKSDYFYFQLPHEPTLTWRIDNTAFNRVQKPDQP